MIVKRGKDKTREERDKRRKKMLRTKYGQKPLKHAKKGVQSCLLGITVLFLLLLMLISSYMTKGDVSIVIGIVALGVLLVAVKGLKLGIKGFREREKNYITCKVGVAFNGLVLLGMAAIFIRGLF